MYTSLRDNCNRTVEWRVIVVPSSPIVVTVMKEALGSSETSVVTRATRRNIQEDTILQSLHNLLIQKTFSLFLLKRWSVTSVAGTRSEDGGDMMEFGAESPVDAVFSYGWIVQMFHSDVPLMLL
jgi:hypothetical protein